jgi:acyl phosphate:glycerol-3-phosphate acyltransferase
MKIMWTELGLLVLAYFLGSLPTGYIVGRIAGVDIRQHGSGSTGATNVWRTIGKLAGVSVFGVDLLKGLLAVFLMQHFCSSSAWWQWFSVGAAMMALLGHTRSVWLGFTGGKAVATGLGVLLMLNWIVALGAFGLWLATMGIWRTVSLSSIVAAIAAPLLMLLTQSNLAYMLFAVVGGAYVVWCHRSNIERLWQGTEPITIPQPQTESEQS